MRVQARQRLIYLPTKLWLEFELNSGEPGAECSDWDTELNDWLIQKKVKAVDEQDEIVRFLLVLRDLLQKTEVHLGDGCFSAVLIDVLKNTGLAADPHISFILSQVGDYTPHRGTSYASSIETVKAALSACARLLKELRLAEDVVLRILVGSIAKYLDDRFSVTNRAILGLIQSV